MEMEIPLRELADLQQQSAEHEPIEVRIGDNVLRLRRPTGDDQLKWLDGSFGDEKQAAEAMIRALLCSESALDLNDGITEEWIKVVNEAMEEFDPLACFSPTVRCPHCDAMHSHAIDLEEWSIQRLQRRQWDLLTCIHRLAVHYHWSERDILSVPPWRRSYYLGLLEGDG